MFPRPLQKDSAVEPLSQSLHISLALPFEPRNTSKSHIEQRLKQILVNVENELNNYGPKQIVKPFISKLYFIFQSLDYTVAARSVVILLSPFSEKLHYLNIPVQEKVLVGKPFNLHDVLSFKKEEKKFLLLAIDEEEATIYQAFNNLLTPLVHNKRRNALPTGKIATEKFINYVYNNLRIILKAYDLPVVVIGHPKHLQIYQGIAEQQPMASIALEDKLGEVHIQSSLVPFLKNWKKSKEAYLLTKLDNALQKGKLETGIYDVWKAATERKTILLVVEEGYSFPAYLGNKKDLLYADAIPLNSSIQITDAVADAVEKVLIGGADVEMVPKGTLAEHLHIALILA